MLTSKLATAGEVGRRAGVGGGNPPKSIGTIKSWCWPRSVCRVKRPLRLVPKAGANNNLQPSKTQKVSTRPALQFPQTAGRCHIKLAISHKFCSCHRSIHPLPSLGGPCQLESCAAGKRTSGSTVVCVEYGRPRSRPPDKGEQTGPLKTCQASLAGGADRGADGDGGGCSLCLRKEVRGK